MQLKNTENKFGLIAIALHWVMAIMIIGLLIVGLYMVLLPVSPQKLKLFRWHKEYGLLILFLVMLRLGWRFANILPTFPNYLPWWQKLAALSAHYAFYVFMITIPITGWLMSSATGFPVSFFGWFVLPDLVAPNENLRVLLVAIHKWFGYGLIVVIGMHVGATLQHYVIHKDNILRRIWL